MRCEHTRENSWWEYDARGIPLARVCDDCRAEKLRGFRSEVLKELKVMAELQISNARMVANEFDHLQQQDLLLACHADHVSVRETADLLVECYIP